MLPSARSLVLAGTAGFALSLLSALPASAHGLAAAGLIPGALHPLTGPDHLLLLVGVGALAARVDRSLLLPALGAAVLGAVFGAAGGQIPAAELLAALSVSALGLLLLLARRLRQAGSGRWLSGAVVAAAVAIHALLHGGEASADPTWWLGAGLAAVAVVGSSALLLSRAGGQLSRTLAVLLGIAGLVLASLPFA